MAKRQPGHALSEGAADRAAVAESASRPDARTSGVVASAERSNESGHPAPDGDAVGEATLAGKSSPAEAETPSETDAVAGSQGGGEVAENAALGKALYAQHCAGCHGERGDGRGIAAAFLFPKPRDFRAGRFRLASTDNRVPTQSPMDGVLVRGMPGSAMPPWPHLSRTERDALIAELMRLRYEGAREQYVRLLREEEGLSDEEIAAPDVQQEIEEFANSWVTPGQTTDVPEIAPPTESSIARGKEVYFKISCHSCHGEQGRGDGVQQMVDDEGLPTAPRDFTRGIFKGSPDPESLYRRIVYGMPGTPMPAVRQADPQDMIALVHFVRSLSDEDTRQAAVLNRGRIVVGRVESLPTSTDDPRWSQASSLRVRLTPLWWRQDFDPVRDAVDVRAVHDGQDIALQLSWQDATHDSEATATGAFEDGVAVALVRGPEPFIGMGAAKAAVDAWYWDSDRQSAADPLVDRYPRTAVDVYPFSEQVVTTGEFARPGTRPENQPALSLPARASGNLIVPDGRRAASALTATGPGTVTFRMPQSQLIEAQGQWQDGRWTVLIRRSLKVASADDGLSLVPGDRVSAAFAVWDGAHRDRDGQKLISIWQEFVLQD